MNKKLLKQRLDEAKEIWKANHRQDERGIWIMNCSLYHCFISVLAQDSDIPDYKDHTTMQVWNDYLKEARRENESPR